MYNQSNILTCRRKAGEPIPSKQNPQILIWLFSNITRSHNLQNEQRIYIDCNNQHLSTIQGGAR
jgi:hypothetical protein